jgi:hypothetical protein
MGKDTYPVSDSSQAPATESALIAGDYYQGTYGPTIILIASTSAACVWLQNIFLELATGGRSRTLTAEPEVLFTNVESIEMVGRTGGPRVALGRRDDGTERTFVWSATPDGWQYLAELIQPLCDGGVGHHYLAEGKDDVALIELSVGEEEVLRALRSAHGRSTQDDGR